MLSTANELRCLGFDKVHEKLVNYDGDIPTRCLYDCYKNPSSAKWCAYHECLAFCESLHGLRFSVSAYNSMSFSAEFIFRFMGIWYFARITKSHNHVFPIQNAIEVEERYGSLVC